MLISRTALNVSVSAGWHCTHMTNKLQAQSCWSQLSIELCNAILMQVASRASVWEPMGELYKLPWVCTRFRDTFKQHSHLQSIIRLDCAPSSVNLPHYFREYSAMGLLSGNTYITAVLALSWCLVRYCLMVLPYTH